jgi:hypothetical protein
LRRSRRGRAPGAWSAIFTHRPAHAAVPIITTSPSTQRQDLKDRLWCTGPHTRRRGAALLAASSFTWDSTTPEELGFDPARLKEAIDLAKAAEAMQTEGDIETMTRLGCAGEAYTEIVGPMRNRGGHNG